MSDYCEVELSDYDGDQPTCFSEREVVARKAHSCIECRESIPKGQHHHVISGKWEGTFDSFRFCDACWEILNEFSEGQRVFGCMWDTFQDEWANGARLQGCLNRLTSVAAKELMTREWQRWKGLS